MQLPIASMLRTFDEEKWTSRSLAALTGLTSGRSQATKHPCARNQAYMRQEAACPVHHGMHAYAEQLTENLSFSRSGSSTVDRVRGSTSSKLRTLTSSSRREVTRDSIASMQSPCALARGTLRRTVDPSTRFLSPRHVRRSADVLSMQGTSARARP